MRSEVSAQSSSGAGSSSSSSRAQVLLPQAGGFLFGLGLGVGLGAAGSGLGVGFFFGFEAGVEQRFALFDDTSRVFPDQDVGLVVQHEVLVTAESRVAARTGRTMRKEEAEIVHMGDLSETSPVPSQDCRRKRRFVRSFKLNDYFSSVFGRWTLAAALTQSGGKPGLVHVLRVAPATVGRSRRRRHRPAVPEVPAARSGSTK